MNNKNPIYGQGSGKEKSFKDDPWHERYKENSSHHSPLNCKARGEGDGKIWEEVCDSLTNAFDVDARQIRVNVERGIVLLTGSVSSPEESWRAEKIILDVEGVDEVINRLHIIY